MQVSFSTDLDGLRAAHDLTDRWNDRPWNGFAAGAVSAVMVSAGIGRDGGYAVTVELREGTIPARGRTADFAATLGPATASDRQAM